MLAQTLQEWEERNIRRGREEGIRRGREEGIRRGREEGIRRGREEELCNLAARRFDDATAIALRPVLGSLRDAAWLTDVGVLIVDSKTGGDLLTSARRLAARNGGAATPPE